MCQHKTLKEVHTEVYKEVIVSLQIYLISLRFPVENKNIEIDSEAIHCGFSRWSSTFYFCQVYA